MTIPQKSRVGAKPLYAAPFSLDDRQAPSIGVASEDSSAADSAPLEASKAPWTALWIFLRSHLPTLTHLSSPAPHGRTNELTHFSDSPLPTVNREP
jgi:hypothetical protein